MVHGPVSAGWETYAHASAVDHFAEWAESTCVQSVDRFAGRPLVLEPWQREFLAEALAVDECELPYWAVVLALLPRKNGKSTLLGSYALYHLDTYGYLGPEVLLAASSDEQAGRLYDAASGFVRRSPRLQDEMHLRDYIGQVARVDGLGTLRRMANDYRRLHGYNPSLVVADELHAWTTANMRKAWEALTSGDAAREWRQVFGITTAGEAADREESILGQLLDGAAAAGELELRPGLRIIRHHGARVLVYEWSAGRDADPTPLRAARAAWRRAVDDHGEESGPARDALAVVEEWRRTVGRAAKLANPASWITPSSLADKAESPKLSPPAFLQLHAGVWADDVSPFITLEEWDALADPDGSGALAGRHVCVGIDGSYSYDTTVVAHAGRVDGDLVRVEARVFSARVDAPHHVLCPGGHIDFQVVEDHAVGLPHRVVEVGFDPRYLAQTADNIADRLPRAAVFSVEPQSQHMRDALTCLHRLVTERRLRHSGDRVIRAHVAACRGKFDADRGWTVRKREASKPIDAVIALAIAVWRAETARAAASMVPAGYEA